MVGFPHSEILGSKLIRSSPRLIAAYYVLHRLHTPRHPLDALKTLGRSHYQCPQLQQPIQALVFLGRSQSSGRSIYPTHLCIGFDRSDQKKPIFTHSTVPPRGCRVKQTVICLFTMSKDPVADTSKSINTTKLALLSSHASVFSACANRAFSPQIHPPEGFALRDGSKMVEPSGIEPLTSCLQSRRSPS